MCKVHIYRNVWASLVFYCSRKVFEISWSPAVISGEVKKIYSLNYSTIKVENKMTTERNTRHGLGLITAAALITLGSVGSSAIAGDGGGGDCVEPNLIGSHTEQQSVRSR